MALNADAASVTAEDTGIVFMILSFIFAVAILVVNMALIITLGVNSYTVQVPWSRVMLVTISGLNMVITGTLGLQELVYFSGNDIVGTVSSLSLEQLDAGKDLRIFFKPLVTYQFFVWPCILGMLLVSRGILLLLKVRGVLRDINILNEVVCVVISSLLTLSFILPLTLEKSDMIAGLCICLTTSLAVCMACLVKIVQIIMKNSADEEREAESPLVMRTLCLQEDRGRHDSDSERESPSCQSLIDETHDLMTRGDLTSESQPLISAHSEDDEDHLSDSDKVHRQRCLTEEINFLWVDSAVLFECTIPLGSLAQCMLDQHCHPAGEIVFIFFHWVFLLPAIILPLLWLRVINTFTEKLEADSQHHPAEE